MPTQGEISLNPVSAKGDILTHNSSSRSRLGIGSDNQILTARSTATLGIAWESKTVNVGDFVLIASSSVTASATSITISSAPQSAYDHFLLTGTCVGLGGVFNGGIILTNNTSTTGGFPYLDIATGTGGLERQYDDNSTYLQIDASSVSQNGNYTFSFLFFNWGGSSSNVSTRAHTHGIIYEYGHAVPQSTSGSGFGISHMEAGTFTTASSDLTSLSIKSAQNDGTFGAGSKMSLWGIRKSIRTYA